MAWDNAGDGAMVTGTTGTGAMDTVPLVLTSTSTVLFTFGYSLATPEWMSGGTKETDDRPGFLGRLGEVALGPRLRMFAFTSPSGAPIGTSLNRVPDPIYTWQREPSLTGLYSGRSWSLPNEDPDDPANDSENVWFIGYIDSDRDLAFDLDATGSSKPIQSTAIPSAKWQESGWSYDVVSDYATGSTTSVSTGMVVVYKDPCVVRVPDELLPDGVSQCYLMLLVRDRYRLEDVEDRPPPEGYTSAEALVMQLFQPAPPPAVGNDVVAYLCEHLSFTGETLRGPYLVVHQRDALPDDLGLKATATVPTGAFAQDEQGNTNLYVYYACGAAGPKDPAVYPKDPYVEDGLRDAIVHEVESSGLGDDGAGYADILLDYTDDTGVLPGTVAVKMFSEDDVRDLLEDLLEDLLDPSTGPGPDEEASWDLSDALPAEWTEWVRFWIAGTAPGRVRQVVAMEAAFPDQQVKPTDPAAVVADEQLCLYFSNVGNDPAGSDSSRGLWRSAALPGGSGPFRIEDRGPALTPTFGVDFLIDGIDRPFGSQDRVTNDTCLDPDPVYVRGTSKPWRVYAGRVDPGTGRTVLTLYEGDDEDGSGDWTEAWV